MDDSLYFFYEKRCVVFFKIITYTPETKCTYMGKLLHKYFVITLICNCKIFKQSRAHFSSSKRKWTKNCLRVLFKNIIDKDFEKLNFPTVSTFC